MLKFILEDPQNWWFRNPKFLWETACWFSGELLKSFRFWLNKVDHLYWHLLTIPVSQNLATKRSVCPSINYFALAKFSPVLSLCQKYGLCGKVDLNNFYPLLPCILSSLIHVGVKRISQACCLHHLKNYGKMLWNKTQLVVISSDMG